ncbi:hypothetical protein [Cellulophaga sp. Hel_I_12]|uniref:hypothetical protein n=1 Tax=Cellulophaga sp. Hel_I_12 TaxID=1249972 RepID=UPI0006482621|nr:hypothetical protein [Cellulophaga sp. Hel_I_12]
MKNNIKIILMLVLVVYGKGFSQTSEQQKKLTKNQKSMDSISQCISLEEALELAHARKKSLEAALKAKNNNIKVKIKDSINNKKQLKTLLAIPESDFVFSGDYNDLLTLELASRISGFEPFLGRKTHILQGMTGEILRYNWENGREEIKEKSPTNRKRTVSSRTDIIEIKWVDSEADMESFLNFIDLEKYPEKTKVNGVGENAFWSPTKEHLEVYYHGISFTLKVAISDDAISDKEKTLALAKLIIAEQLN